MSDRRLIDYLDHMYQAASDAGSFVAGFSKEQFLADRRTQRAVIMSLLIIGEAASKIMGHYPQFAANNPGLPWRSIRGMRNRMAHGYFDVDLDVVWDTVQVALPDLMEQMPSIRQDAEASTRST